MRFIDLTGQKFGRLTVIEKAEKTKHGATKWRCKCECGNETFVISDELRKGATQSCGCYKKEISKILAKEHIAGKNKTHGKTGTLIYKEWSEMKRRCFNSHDTSFQYYGARGITVCEKWKNDFEAFYEDVSKLPNFGKEGYSLNRIDNNGNYEPDNVGWANDITQANNRRTTILINYNNKKYPLSELARMYRVSSKKLYKRYIVLHWDIEKALNTP